MDCFVFVRKLVTGLWSLDIVGLILLATAYFGTCVAYLPLGVDTAKESPDD